MNLLKSLLTTRQTMRRMDFRYLKKTTFKAGAKVKKDGDDQIYIIKEVHDQQIILEDGSQLMVKEVSLC